MVWHAVSNCRHRVHHFVAGCRVATTLITLPLYCYCIANVLQLLKVAQLGLKPAPEFAAWLERMQISDGPHRLREDARQSGLFRHRLLAAGGGE